MRNKNIEALDEELDFLKRIPMAELITGALKAEIPTSKRVAIGASPDLNHVYGVFGLSIV